MHSRLTSILGAGRRHSMSDEGMVQTIHDQAVALGAVCETTESATQVHAGDELLSELAMSHGDLANLLRMALKGEYTGRDTYVWTRDVYDDHVVYEVTSDGQDTLYQRSYAIVDGAVTFGDAVRVIAVTQYVPVEEAEREGIIEREFSQDQRDKLAKSGAALPGGGFPIQTVQDLKNAIKAYGRAKNKAAAKRHIVKRARALGATDLLPEEWGVSAESDREDLTGDLVPLVEKAVKKDGSISLRIIAPGQGSSGYYPADVLKRDGPKVFKAQTHMHLDHPSISEETDRPERSVTTLAGTLTSDARWEENGAAGPGLYADATVRSDLAPLIEELAPHIGVSIRALGKAGTREIDGKKVRSIEAIEQAKSVDFVTIAGAGGKVLDLIESARQRQQIPREDDDMSAQELEEARTKIAEAERKNAELQGRIEAMERREAEAKLLREAATIVTEHLAGIALPVPTRARLQAQLTLDPPLKDGALDIDALKAKVKEAATAELAYLAEATGNTGRVVGMGGAAPTDADVQKDLVAAFKEAGYSDDVAAKMAAR